MVSPSQCTPVFKWCPPLNVPLCLNRSSPQQIEANWRNLKSDISTFCQRDRRLDCGLCLLFVCVWTGVHVETQNGFAVSCLIKQRKDWPSRFDEQPCWCCVLSTNMTLLVGLSLQRTDSTFLYIVWFSDIGRKGVTAQSAVGNITAVINAYVYWVCGCVSLWSLYPKCTIWEPNCFFPFHWHCDRHASAQAFHYKARTQARCIFVN